MSDKDILKKIVEQLEESPDRLMRVFDDSTFNTYGNELRMDLVRGYIFSHEFAKKLFGEVDLKNPELHEPMCAKRSDRQPWKWACSCRAIAQGWEWHLKQMVIRENPIKYLEQFIKETK